MLGEVPLRRDVIIPPGAMVSPAGVQGPVILTPQGPISAAAAGGGGGGGGGAGGFGGGGGKGAKGPAGPTGAAGTAGAQGPQGNQGDLGNQGFQGTNPGPTGAQGNQGNQGNTGAGFQGPQGNQGFQGTNPGPLGPQGNQGPIGATGAGVQGPQGPQGVKGNQGKAGLGNSLIFNVNATGVTSTGALGFTPKAVYFVGSSLATFGPQRFRGSCSGFGNAVGTGECSGTGIRELTPGTYSGNVNLSGSGIIGKLPTLSGVTPSDSSLSITAFSAAGVSVTWSSSLAGMNFEGKILIIG